MALDPAKISVTSKTLHCPPLDEIVSVLNQGLKFNFSTVKCEVVECPDLSVQPYTLAGKYLGGNPRLVEIGGPSYLLPLVNKDKLYELKQLPKLVHINPLYVIGAGAGPYPLPGVNCEGMINLGLDNGKVINQTRIAKVDVNDSSKHILSIVPENETRCALLANLFCSNGLPGKVIKVHCLKRIGEDDFIASIRKTLADHYKDSVVGLGGTFLLKEGKAKQHVMPDFSKTPITSDDGVNNWLKFYNMSAPLIAVGTLVTQETELDLRVQHFHSFSHHGEGGHYHNDTTPDVVEYIGYFNVAETVYRLDQPTNAHKFGRD